MNLGYYDDKTVLITGSSGFIGSNLVKKIGNRPCRVICQYKSRKPEIDKAAYKNIEFVNADLGDGKFWEELLPDTDIVFHLASQTSAREANAHPVEDIHLNYLPIATFIESCIRKNTFPVIVAAGSATQVGFTSSVVGIQQKVDRPVTVYDINKLASEQLINYYRHTYPGSGATLRLTNVYGPGPTAGMSDRGITNMMMGKALSGDSLTLYGEGDYLRDYIYIDDVIDAFLAAGIYIENMAEPPYVIGSGKGVKIKDMATAVAKIAAEVSGGNVKIEQIDEPENLLDIDRRDFEADISAFSSATGWRPKYTLEEGLLNTARFLFKGK